jgi:hypothetical protein
MRIISSIAGLALAAFVGWIVGGLYPPPPALLAWVNRDAVAQRWNELEAQVLRSSAPPATVAASATAATATSPASGGAVDAPTLQQLRAWISEARRKYPYADSEERMYAVMICESKGQAGIVNPAGPYSGLFQYSPGLWKGAWNVYRDQDVLDPKAQIFATALAWQKNMQGQWGCYTHPH